MLKVSTFCSGVGSPEQAIKNLGIEHEVVLTAEIDKYARQTYLANHSTKKMINDMTEPDYEGEEYYADINISGLPCQSFSLAGKRLGELDPRGLLFFDFLRYVKNQNPKYFIIENVKGLLSDNDGETFRNWIQLLGQSENGNTFMFPHEDSLMYNLHWQVLNTKDYGLPQNRERVFLIGIRNDLPNSFVFPKGLPLKLRLKDILEESVDEKYYLSDKMVETLARHENKIIENTNPEVSATIHAGYFKMGGRDQQYLKVQSATKSESLLKNIGNIYPSGGQNGNIYDAEGISPTLASGTTDNSKNGGIGSNNAPKVIVKSATKSGYEIATEGDSINLEHPNSETRRGRVGKQVAQTLTTSCNQGVVQLNPSLESGGKQPYQQNRVYDSEGIAPALCRGKSDLNVTYTGTSCNQGVMIGSAVQKDNLVVIHNIKQQVTVRKFEVNTILLKEILIDSKKEKGISIKDIAEKLNTEKTKVEHWFRRDNSFSIPDANIWFDLKKLLNINRNDFDKPITEFITKDGVFEKADRVYDECGIAPTLTSTSANEKVLVNDIIQLNNPKHSNDRIYSEEGLSPTLNTMQGGNRQPFIQVTGSTVQKDNLVVESLIIDDTQGFGDDRVYTEYSPSLRANRSGLKTIDCNFRIRKLTPLECFRLQGFPDDFKKPVSNSQLYKQAGNTISVNVIQAILKNLLT